MDTTKVDVTWRAVYSDGTVMDNYEDGRKNTFYDIEQGRLKRMDILVNGKPQMSFTFHPEIMRLILFKRHRVEYGRGITKKQWLFFGFQMTVKGTNYQCLWSIDLNTHEIDVVDKARRVVQ
jgi:hypothetical protein